jgi:hypothetical protein
MSVFQLIEPKDYVFETEYFFAIYDRFPVSPGHLLIISKALKQDYFSLHELEKNDLTRAISEGKDVVEQQHSPSGYNIGMNCGEDAGQTVPMTKWVKQYSLDCASHNGDQTSCEAELGDDSSTCYWSDPTCSGTVTYHYVYAYIRKDGSYGMRRSDNTCAYATIDTGGTWTITTETCPAEL